MESSSNEVHPISTALGQKQLVIIKGSSRFLISMQLCWDGVCGTCGTMGAGGDRADWSGVPMGRLLDLAELCLTDLPAPTAKSSCMIGCIWDHGNEWMLSVGAPKGHHRDTGGTPLPLLPALELSADGLRVWEIKARVSADARGTHESPSSPAISSGNTNRPGSKKLSFL